MRFAVLIVLLIGVIALAGCGPIPDAPVVPTALATPSAAGSDSTSALPAGFTTYHDPAAGFAIDYPAAWSVSVPPESVRPQAQSYTASFRSVSTFSPGSQGQGFQEGASGMDVTVWRTRVSTFEEAVAERRAEILNFQIPTRIASEELFTLRSGLPAVRWRLETSVTGPVVEVLTLLGGNRIMVDGIGDLTRFDAITATLRPAGAAPLATILRNHVAQYG